MTIVLRVAVEAARAGVPGAHKHKTSGEGDDAGCASDCDVAVFEGLAEDFEDITGKFG
jgi:hypothetical protein